MLAGQQHQVGRGYFITCRAPPMSDDHDHSHEVQRRDRQSLAVESAAEESFFNGQSAGAVWPQEFAQFANKCGIDQLVKFLAQTLAEEFARNLPGLSRTLNTKLQHTHDSLRRLPDMPQNPEHVVRKSLLKFTADFQSRLTSKAFGSSWAKIAETFKIRVLDLKPRYKVMPEGFTMVRDPSAGGSDRESVFSANNSPSLSIKRPRPVDLTSDAVTPSAQRRRGESGWVKIEEGSHSFSGMGSPIGNGSSYTANGRVPARTLGAIRNLIRSEREAGKPGEVPYDV